jgi:hypothetical protein
MTDRDKFLQKEFLDERRRCLIDEAREVIEEQREKEEDE